VLVVIYFKFEIKYGEEAVMEEADVNERRAKDRLEVIFQAALNDNNAV